MPEDFKPYKHLISHDFLSLTPLYLSLARRYSLSLSRFSKDVMYVIGHIQIQFASYRERSLRYQLDRRLDGPQISSERNIEKINAIELHSSGLIGTASHSDMQKIQIMEFFFFK